MDSFEQGVERQRDAAAERVAERTPVRNEHEAALAQPGGIATADTPQRIAARLDRLSRYYAGAEPPRAEGATAEPEVLVEQAVERVGELVGNGSEPEKLLEKIINTADFVGIRYLDAGVAAGRAIGRVNIRGAGGRLQGYGTGSLVSPTLLLTNHHVLPDAATAGHSVIEFNFQDGIDGRPLLAEVFPLDPDRFFLADEERDFALVAVAAPPEEIAPFGFNRLIEAEGKAIIGEFVTIVQHPRGEKKQVALRENRIVDIPERFLHYSADTEPGSSGSLVFNDQWEAVALHHASVPAPERKELGGFMNEGIRISRIIKFIKEQPLAPDQRALADQVFAPGRVEAIEPPPSPVPAPVPAATAADPAAPAAPAVEPGGEVTITVPVQITVRVGSGADAGRGDLDRPGLLDARRLRRGVPGRARPAARNGAGACGGRVGGAALPPLQRRDAPQARARPLHGREHRRQGRQAPRARERPLDPRPAAAGDRADRRGRLPRQPARPGTPRAPAGPGVGHRAAWPRRRTTTRSTSPTPPRSTMTFNAGHTLWAGLEDYVLNNADTSDLAVSVLTGPVLEDSDEAYRGVQLPRQFWKIIAMVNQAGALSVTGYLLSQASLLDDLETFEEFSYGAYRTFQVPVSRIAALTGLGLDPHAAADPLERLEATPLPRELIRREDLIL